MKIDDDKFPWNILGKLIYGLGREQEKLYEQGDKEMRVLFTVIERLKAKSKEKDYKLEKSVVIVLAMVIVAIVFALFTRYLVEVMEIYI